MSIETLPLVELAAWIRQRRISPVEAVDAYLNQIERVNPAINAFITLMADRAREAALAAEASLMRGDNGGPLFGVPLTIKDSLNVEGQPTYCGSLFHGEIAIRDSAVARMFRAAGGILLGKTNTPEFLANYESDNHIAGRTNNPWNLDYTAGGSSGGEAAAISAFCSAGGMGSDGGGSVRVPAHFCGIAGLKPTPGRVSAAGHVPAIEHPGGLLGVVGPMARNVRDVRELFEVCSDYDYEDPFAAPVPLRPANTGGVRIGVMEQFLKVPVRDCVRDAVRRAAGLLVDRGFTVDAFAPTGLERAPNVWSFFFTDLPSRAIARFIAGREDQAHWTGVEFLEKILATPEPTGMRVVEMLGERDRIRMHLLRQMEDFPVILMPVAGVPAFRHRERRWETATKSIGLFEAMMPVTVFNLVGFPALTVPVGMSPEGLPVGVQLVGRPYSEELLLKIGEELETARGPFGAPLSGVHSEPAQGKEVG
jgi:Asp-tRNA(Asn)/Glu-tRNA(Gln) amidotransferase A subunit family amidase